MHLEREKQKRFLHCVMLEKEGKFDEAIREYQRLIEELGGEKEFFINLGSLYAKKELFDDALHCFTSALQYGDDYLVHFNIASVLYRQGNYNKAVEHLKLSRTMKPDFSLANLVLGLCFSRMNKMQMAQHCFEEVLNESPDNMVALTALSVISFQKGEFSKAIKYVDRILQNDPNNREVKKLCAKILYRMEKHDEFGRTIKEIKTESSEYLNFDKFIQSIPIDLFTDKYGTLNQKIAHLKREIDKDKGISRLISLSLCYLFKGETDEAIDVLVEARKKNVRH